MQLKNVTDDLHYVEKNSHNVLENAKLLKEAINAILDGSASLKTLSDGFDVVLEKRNAQRTVLSPPAYVNINIEKSAKSLSVFVFDKSNAGLSFYNLDNDDFSMDIGDYGSINCKEAINGKTNLRFTVVYKSKKTMNNLLFYGVNFD